MGNFLKAAHLILSDNKRPMSAQEIVVDGLERGLLPTKGRTPSQTMKAKLSTDILNKKDRSIFMRSEAGKFALREWKQKMDEHIAPRFKKALFDEDIMVFHRSSLRKYISGIGLSAGKKIARSLLSDCFSMKRRLAEEDFTVVQLVSFYIVRYESRILTYKRTKRLPESRLHGYYSLGFGGHLNPDDVPPLFNFIDPQQALLLILRELKEELILKKQPIIKFRGLLYDDSREVSKQHLGLVYDVFLKSPEYEIGERGFLMDAKYETLSEILDRIEDFENWSALIAEEESKID